MSRLALTKQNSMMLFQSMKITQRSKKVWKYGPWTGVNIFWEGRAEKEGEGVTSDMLFPSSGISLKSQYMGQFLEGWTTNPSRVKWIYVQHLSVRPPAGCNARSSSPMGTSVQYQLHGPGKMGFQLLLLPETFFSKLSCTSSLVHSGAQVRMSERRNICAREGPW